MNLLIKGLLIMTFLFLAVISDIRTRKIKNRIVLAFILVGLLANLFENGWTGILDSLWGITFPVMVLFPLFLLKMLGAGDIKCFSAIGAIMGAEFVTYSMIYSFIAGGVIALIIMALNKNALQRFGYLISYLKVSLLTLSLSEYDNLQKSKGAFRFTYAIFLGVILQYIKI